jgi:hypothetical protein
LKNLSELMKNRTFLARFSDEMWISDVRCRGRFYETISAEFYGFKSPLINILYYFFLEPSKPIVVYIIVKSIFFTNFW